MTRSDASARLFRLLLRLYPRVYRERFETELTATFREERRVASAHGSGAFRFWLWILTDLVVSAARRRVEEARSQRAHQSLLRNSPMDVIRQDLRYAFRMQLRNPLFTAVAMLTIALGVGANTTIFGAVHAVLLRELPMHEPEQLAVLRMTGNVSVSKQQLQQVRERSRSFEGVAAYSGWGLTVTGGGEPMALQGARVTADFFELMGARAVLGRAFRAGDDAPGSAAMVVLSHALWRARYRQDPGIVGQDITIGGSPHTVIGVMLPEFRYPSANTQLWIPAVMDPADTDDWSTNYLTLIGRLRGGATTAAAAGELRALARAMRAEQPQLGDTFGDDASVTALRDQLVGGMRPMLLLLLSAAGCVLLIACVNVANLLLTRATARERELATRAALGASPGRVVRQLATESLVLAISGGLAGMALALWGTRALSAALPIDLHGAADVRIEPAVLVFALGTTIAAGLLFGLVPAVRAARTQVAHTLRAGGRSESPSRRRRGLLDALVVSEIALAVTLVAAATLMLRSFWNLRTEFTGYQGAQVLTMNIAPPPAMFSDHAQVTAYWREVTQRVRALPGVVAAGGVHLQPFGGSNWNPSVRVRDRDVPAAQRPEVYWRIASGDYFLTMGIPVQAGRAFDERDDATAPGVAIINETFARQVFPDEDPLGREIRTGFEARDTWVRVVGVVGDTRDMALGAAVIPQMYRPMAQWPVPILSLMVRTTVDPPQLAPSVRQAIWDIAADVPISDVRSFDSLIAGSVRQPRLVAGLLSGFGALALLLGVVGVYGVLSYVVGQRRREFGIRLALGARRSEILGIVLRHALPVALLGVAIGLGAAWAGTRLLRSQLYELSPGDPLTLAVAAATLIGTAMLAALGPAHAAARVDPMQSIRSE